MESVGLDQEQPVRAPGPKDRVHGGTRATLVCGSAPGWACAFCEIGLHEHSSQQQSGAHNRSGLRACFGAGMWGWLVGLGGADDAWARCCDEMTCGRGIGVSVSKEYSCIPQA